MNEKRIEFLGKALYHLGVKDINFWLHHRLLGKPYHWTDFPNVIQLDLNNHCGTKFCGVFCTYCRPQSDILKGIKRYAEMPDAVLDWILRDVSEYGRNMSFICDFLDGDGLSPLLPDKRARIKKAAPWLKVQTFTCGTRPENAHLLVDRNLDWINVTLSAHNEAIYRLVHRGNRFRNVLETMRYLSDHRLPNQTLEVHYVINKFNIANMADWLNMIQRDFPDWTPKFSPLVNTGSDDVSNNACGTLSTLDQETAIKSVKGSAFWDRREIGMRQPCVLWHNASVTANGELLQCCRWDKLDYHYGLAQDYIKNGWRFREYWLRKLANRLQNPFCDRCNLKVPNWKEKASKIYVSGGIKP